MWVKISVVWAGLEYWETERGEGNGVLERDDRSENLLWVPTHGPFSLVLAPLICRIAELLEQAFF